MTGVRHPHHSLLPVVVAAGTDALVATTGAAEVWAKRTFAILLYNPRSSRCPESEISSKAPVPPQRRRSFFLCRGTRWRLQSSRLLASCIQRWLTSNTRAGPGGAGSIARHCDACSLRTNFYYSCIVHCIDCRLRPYLYSCRIQACSGQNLAPIFREFLQ